MTRDAKVVCQTCKARKVRCDGGRPSCGRCLLSKRACKYGSKMGTVSFRHSKFSSVAVSGTPPAEGGQSEPSGQSVLEEQDPVEESLPGSLTSFRGLETAPSSESAVAAVDKEPHAEPHTPLTYGHAGASNSSLISVGPHAHRWGVDASSPSAGAELNGRQPNPTIGPVEGELLHFYVCYAGPWLDVTSPERHYTYTVPRLALRNPLLLYAVLSCAARIYRLRNKGSREFEEAEDRYQHMCVMLLIPLLDDLPAAIQDDAILATIVILRMSEQHNEYDTDRQFHLVPGAFSHYGPIRRSSTTEGGLQEATFYSYVKSDIRVAILERRWTKLAVDSWPLENSEPQNDADWANRVTWLLVQAINLCYGGQDIPGLLPRHLLERYVDEWKRDLPDTFDPYYFHEQDTEPFPVIRLLAPWHIVGLQFYHASKILLAAHPPPGAPFTDAWHFNHQLQSVILPHARLLCAISFSNDHHGGRINASHLVAMAAQYLHGREERARVHEYFKTLHEESGWPNRLCLDMLNGSLYNTDYSIPS